MEESPLADRPRAGRILIAVLFAVGIFLRVYAVDRIPLPIYQDELSNIYDAYSIVETGMDRAGSRTPIVVRAFGENDYRPAMMVWLTTIPVMLSGVSTASGRAVSATLGILTMILIFALARRAAGEGYATMVLAFAALSPWLIFDARVAHEGAALAPFFVMLALFLWHRAASKDYSTGRTALLGFALGLSANAYQTTRLIGPLLVMLIVADMIRTKRRIDSRPLTLGAFALLAAAPQIWILLASPERFFSRAAETVVSGTGPVDTMMEIVSGFAANFTPRYLFWPDMTEAFLTTARLLPVEVVFLSIGLLTMWKMRGWELERFRVYLYLALIIAALPAALTNQNPHSLRAASCAPLLTFFSAAGVIAIDRRLDGRGGLKRLFRSATAISILASFCFVAYMYLWSPSARGLRMQNGLFMAATSVRSHLPRYDRVLIDSAGLHPYIYFVAFKGMTPQQYHASPKEIHSVGGWDKVKRVGKFHFRGADELLEHARQPDRTSRDLFVTRTPLAGSRIVDSVSWHLEKYYIADFP